MLDSWRFEGPPSRVGGIKSLHFMGESSPGRMGLGQLGHGCLWCSSAGVSGRFWGAERGGEPDAEVSSFSCSAPPPTPAPGLAPQGDGRPGKLAYE